MAMQKTKVWFRLLRAMIHMIIVLAVFYATYLLRLQTDLIPGVQIRIPMIDTHELTIFALLAVVSFFLLGLYNNLYQLSSPFAKNYRTLFKVWTYWVILMTFIAYFGDGFIFSHGLSRLIWIWTSLFSLVTLFFVEWILIAVDRYIQKNIPTTILFVYKSEDEFARVQDAVSFANYQKVHAVSFDDFSSDLVTGFDHVIVVGGISKVLLQETFDTVRLAGKKFFHIAEGFFLEDVIYKPDRLGSIMAFEYKSSQLDGWAVVIKRLMDMVVSFCALLLLFPVFVLIAITLKLNSSGPIFYVQKRVGRNGKLFDFVKFRTMHTAMCVGEKYGGEKAMDLWNSLMNSSLNIRKGELQKIKNDPRVTSLGKFLRRTSLDELPNLFSVLVGDMSLVGPRPHMEFEIARYKPRHKRLLSVKPGITGYSQIKGRDDLTFDQEAYYDLAYIQQWSILLDLLILFRTVGVVFLRSDR